jgi:cysteine desulfurase
MAKSRIYFDYNATAPLRPEAARAVSLALGVTGNASSVHAEGRAARALIEKARGQVAGLIGAREAQVTFTSGGTEANNLALGPSLHRSGEPAGIERLFVSAIEHPSVLSGHRFAADRVETVPVLACGRVDLDGLKARLAALPEDETFLVSAMLANNETGIIQPLAEIVEMVHAFGGFVHSDAVQAAGKIPIDFAGLGVDLMSLSAHKIGGPQGTGALIVADGLVLGEAVVRGGGQEGGRRGGTENLPGIVGFGAAAEAAAKGLADMARVGGLRDQLETGICGTAPGTVVVGRDVQRLANTLCFSPPGCSAETLVIAFDLAGVAVSSGSACSSGKVSASHVLKAMGVAADRASGAVRVSLGWKTQPAEVGRFLEVWSDIWGRAGVRASAA